MSDCYPGEITIGGKIPQSKIAGFIEAVNKQEVCSDYGWGSIVIKNEKELIKFVEERTGKLWFCNDEAENGEFDLLEDYCQENGIAFRRVSSGFDENYVCEYRPGMERFNEFFTDRNETPLIRGDLVKELLDLVDMNIGLSILSEEKIKLLEKILYKSKEIRKLLPVEVESIEPFEIISEEKESFCIICGKSMIASIEEEKTSYCFECKLALEE